jgi:hypothetical protein
MRGCVRLSGVAEDQLRPLKSGKIVDCAVFSRDSVVVRLHVAKEPLHTVIAESMGRYSIRRVRKLGPSVAKKVEMATLVDPKEGVFPVAIVA